MTISSTNLIDIYDSDGVTREWPITFPVDGLTEADIEFYVSEGDISVLKTTGVDVDLAQQKVTYPTIASGLDVLTSSQKAINRRALPLVQEQIDVDDQGAIPLTSIETGFDRLTMMCQQIQEEVDRAVKVDVSSEEDPDDLIDAINQAVLDTAASEAAAAASEANAATSETNAGTSENAAAQSAIDAAASAASVSGFGLQEAFDNGQAITIADTDNQTLAITNNDTTNNPVSLQVINTTTNSGIKVIQNNSTSSDDHGLHVINGAEVTGDALVGFTVQSIGSDSADVLQLTNDGTGKALAIINSNAASTYGLEVVQSGVLTSGGKAVRIYSNAAQTNSNTHLMQVIQDHASSDERVVGIQNDGTGIGLDIDQNGNGIGVNIVNVGTNHGLVVDQGTVLAGGDHGIYMVSGQPFTNTDSAFMFINNTSASSTEPSLEVSHKGSNAALELFSDHASGAHINLSGDCGNSSPVDGDLWYTGSALNFRDGASTVDLLAGGGTWNAYTPSLTNITLGNGTLSAKYARNGDTINYYIKLIFGTTTSFSGNIAMSLPVTPEAIGTSYYTANVMLLDNGSGLYVGWQQSTGSINRLIGATGNIGSVNASAPFTWANTDEVTIQGSYKAA